MRFLAQRGFACFPLAVRNAMIWKRRRGPPTLKTLIEIACCRFGATIHEERVLEASGLDWVRAPSQAVLRQQGIVILMHPSWNLHAVFVFNDARARWFVNAGLGPDLVAQHDAVRLPQNANNRRAWLLR